MLAISGLVRSPSPDARERAEQNLSEALMSEAGGVHDVELDGKTLLVTATYQEDANAQCRHYAQIVQVNESPVNSIALTDPNDPTGNVTLCNVEQTRDMQQIDARAHSGADNPVERKIRADVAAQKLELDALSMGRSEIWLYYRNKRYLQETEAAGRLIRVLMQDAAPGVEIFHLILVEHGVPIREFQIARTAIERSVLVQGGAVELANAVSLVRPGIAQPVLTAALDESEPKLTWSIAPGIRESFFDPNAPIQIQLLVAAIGDLELAPGLDVTGEFDANVYNNYDLSQQPESLLPHVRSDVAQYYKQGANGMEGLEGDYRVRLTPDVTSEFRVGYFEDMFAGVGAETLWRPEGSRFAVGADLYQVWQRNFDRLFGLQQYNVLTGHVTLYYNSPWYGLNFNVHVGRYLAGDYGGTIEITRKFDTGVEIGAFATFTNVPFSKFGEGSFDKGFIVRIPFEWSLPFYTATSHTTILHSLSRDGGQRLDGDNSLYQETRSASYGELSSHIDNIAAP